MPVMKLFICKQCGSSENEKATHRKICKKCWIKNIAQTRKNSVIQQEYINSIHYKELQKQSQINYRNKTNPEKLSKGCRDRMNKQANICSYSYCRKQLKGKGFNSNEITQELIEVQQLIIKTKRLCKTLQN